MPLGKNPLYKNGDMKSLDAVTLHGRHVILQPMASDHAALLLACADRDRSTYAYTWVPANAAEASDYVSSALADRDSGISLPFVTLSAATGEIVGSTRFLNIEYWRSAHAVNHRVGMPDAAEIGGTWLAKSAQRTPFNTEAKLLMLNHAFAAWGVQRLQLKTDARNVQSRTAIARIGAQFEGVLRSNMPRFNDQGPRDSAYFSIMPHEWPSVKEMLQAKLAND